MATRSRKLGGSAKSVADYLKRDEEIAAEVEDLAGYYTAGSSRDGLVFNRAWGKSAERFGLTRGITLEQFEELHAGTFGTEVPVKTSYRIVKEHDPVTGKMVPKVDPKTGEVEKARGIRTPMIDVVFAAPKSVMEYAIATDDAHLRGQIVAAWEDSVRDGIEAMEEHGYLVRESANQRIKGAEIVAIPATQFSARPTEESLARGVPDPHLHTHVAIPTRAFVPDPAHAEDFRPLTIDEYGVKKTAELRDQTVMGQFARRLEALGIELEYADPDKARSGRITWEIKGSDPEMRKFYSTNSERSWAIRREWEAKYGRPITDTELTDQLYLSRGKKDNSTVAKEADQVGAWAKWRQVAVEHGLEWRDATPDRHIRRASAVKRRRELYRRLMSPSGLTRDDATFDRDSVPVAMARCSVGLGFSVDELKAMEVQLWESQIVMVRDAKDERRRLFTTKAELEMEAFIDSVRQQKATQALPSPPDHAVRLAISRQPHALEPQQRDGVLAACSPHTAWIHIDGPAGTGKSALLAAARDAHRAAGTVDTIVVVSTSAKAAEEQGRKLGADTWGSVEAIQDKIKRGYLKPDERTWFIYDEAAMADNPRMAAFCHLAKKSRVTLVGDHHQAPPIGAGGWYERSLAETPHRVTLETVHRHRDQRDVRDYNLLRRGQAQRALENMAMRDRVHVASEGSHPVLDAVERYKEHRAHGYAADQIRFVLDGSNEHVDTLNRIVQADRLSRGEIKGDGFVVTDVEQSRRWQLRRGDQIVFLRGYYNKRDKVSVKNGTSGLLLDLNPETGRAKVELPGRRVVTVKLAAEELRQPLGLAYAQHVTKYQGGEVEIVYALPSTQSSQNSGYSTLTRAKHEAHIFLPKTEQNSDPVKTLAQAWSKPVVKRSATWHVENPHADVRERAIGHRVEMDADLAERAESWAAKIEQTHGPEFASQVASSPAFGALVDRLDELEADGSDAGGMLSEAINEREFDTAEDAAKVLTWRIDRTPERPGPKLGDLVVEELDTDSLPAPAEVSLGDPYDFGEDDYDLAPTRLEPTSLERASFDRGLGY